MFLFYLRQILITVDSSLTVDANSDRILYTSSPKSSTEQGVYTKGVFDSTFLFSSQIDKIDGFFL